ncbi:MAG TPA: hypothetical protein VII42_09285 [Caulobacteraceae bacterium]|jgi:hypothetical protein
MTRLSTLAAVLLFVGLSACGGSHTTPAAVQAAASGQAARSAASAPTDQAAVAAADPQNLLIGKWHLSSFTPNGNLPNVGCTASDMVFTETTQTLIAPDGGSGDTAVTYNAAAPGKVYVMGDTANYVVYDIVDQDHVQPEGVIACIYQRVG